MQAEAPHLAISYLEAALAAGTASHVRYDNELAVKYLELALAADDGAVAAQQSAPQADVLERLKTLVSVLITGKYTVSCNWAWADVQPSTCKCSPCNPSLEQQHVHPTAAAPGESAAEPSQARASGAP